MLFKLIDQKSAFALCGRRYKEQLNSQTLPMNNWTAPTEPHENHRFFAYNNKDRDPVKGGRPQQAKRRTHHNLGIPPTDPKTQFEMMCQELLGLIDEFNNALAVYKLAAANPD